MFLGPEAKGKIYTGVGAFGAGWGMSWVIKKNPTAGLTTAVVVSVGGFLGSLAVKGVMSEVLEGIGAAGLASIGASMPYLLEKYTGGGTTGRGGASGLLGAGQAIAQPSNADALRRYAQGGI